MDYEKKYKEALERARDYKNNIVHEELTVGESIMDYIFPELKESEDEEIKKWLIGYFHQYKEDGMEKYANGLKVESIIAWLEKQGKSSDQIYYWTEEEIEPIISDYLRGAEHYGGMIARLRCLKPKSLEKQGEQKSQRMISAEAKEAMYDKTAWSEEDEKMLVDAYVMLDWYKGNNWWTARRIKDWLKALKQRIGG